jgi:hypothetical protein
MKIAKAIRPRASLCATTETDPPRDSKRGSEGD